MNDVVVSVVVPCRNERRFIGRCLETLLATGFPAERLEILVVDGMSDDGTRDIVAGIARDHPIVKMLDNPHRITPTALNIGIAAARGAIFMRADAHAEYPRNYVTALVGWLERSGADGVGGVCETLPGADGAVPRAIAAALAHPFGVGNSWFRIGTREPRSVDTVPFACYPMALFRRIGGFDEELVRNQDDEFNLRIIRNGGRVLLVPDVVLRYYARTRLRDVARMYYQYGLFKPAVIRKVGAVMTVRQLIPAAFTLMLGASLLLAPWLPGAALAFAGFAALYVAACSIAALPVARRHGPRAGLAMLLVFPALHLGYGAGFLVGAVRSLRRGAAAAARGDALPLSR